VVAVSNAKSETPVQEPLLMQEEYLWAKVLHRPYADDQK
jgi:hypothetical protein